ncbi:MAG: hypothetical protein EBY81_07805 [Verrucomicrobia bacterium]|nr:hypothetical protein [Verrucomicrobiota bacterium]
MADNVTLNTMSGGNTVAADEVSDATLGTVKVQYVKIMDGTLDGTAKANVDANGLRVVDRKGTTIGQGPAAPAVTATQIVAIVSASPWRRSVTISNTGTVSVSIGASGVTAATGILLVPQASVTITDAANAAIYGITASGTGAVTYMTESD